MKDELGVDYPIVSDEDLDLIRKAKLVDPQAPKSVRGFAVLDKDGNVLHSQEIDPFGEEAEGIITYAAEMVNGEK